MKDELIEIENKTLKYFFHTEISRYRNKDKN